MEEQLFAKPQSTTYLVGAGISANSGVPLFQQYRDGFIRALLPDRKAKYLRRGSERSAVEVGLDVFPPEQLFYRLTKLGPEFKNSVVSTIFKYSSNRVPNRNHFALAKALEAGASVWTTNYDTLIEDALTALDLPVHSLSWPADPECKVINCGSLHIYKPHGSIQSEEPLNQNLVFDSEQVLLPLSNAWRDAVANHFSNKTVVLAGYKGNDIDLIPALAATMRESTSFAIWMEFPDSVTDRQRLMLPRTNVVPGNPSIELQAFISRSTSTDIAAICEDVEFRASFVGPVNFVRTHRAAASLLSHIGKSGQARYEYAKSALLDAPEDRKRSRKALTRSVLLDYPFINSMGVRWAKIHLPNSADKSWNEQWAQYLLILERHGVRGWSNTEIDLGVNRQPLIAWNDEARISAITLLKLLGDFSEVQKFIDATMLTSLAPSLEGKVVYNTMWSLRNQGRLGEWDELWDVYESRGSNFDPNWAAWIQLEDADLKTMLGDGLGARLRLDSEALQFARVVRHHDLFRIDADVCERRAQMLIDDSGHDYSHNFAMLYSDVNRNRSLRTPFRRASFSLSWAAALAADPSTKPLVEKLTKRADRLSPSSMHLVISELLKYRHSISPRMPKDELMAICRKTRFGYGEALVARFFDLDIGELQLSGSREFFHRWDSLHEPIFVVP